jgi:transcription antitermination factor NusA-like protein
LLFFRNHTSSRPVAIEVRIPADQVGAIIGRGGENIKEIQRKTKTRIDFKDDNTGSSNLSLKKSKTKFLLL